MYPVTYSHVYGQPQNITWSSFQVLWERNSHLMLCKVLKPARVREAYLTWAGHSLKTQPWRLLLTWSPASSYHHSGRQKNLYQKKLKKKKLPLLHNRKGKPWRYKRKGFVLIFREKNRGWIFIYLPSDSRWSLKIRTESLHLALTQDARRSGLL